MPRSEIFAATGYEPWAISSLFQLLAMQRDRWPALALAGTMLNMPDLFNYFLTGVRASEMSIANTSNLMGTDGNWCRAVIDRFGLPGNMFCKMIPPATVLGELTPDLQRQTGMGPLKVCASCGHDTSAAVAAVGAKGDNWAFLSCGTWSILGTMVPAPLTAQRCLDNGFMNEYTIGGWYLARNISGLWLVQQLKAKWEKAGTALDYATLTGEAANESACAMFDAADDSLMAPADMEEAILHLCGRGRVAANIAATAPAGAALPRSRGQMIRTVLESLALEYNRRLEMLGDLTGRAPAELYMVGGGIKNRLLCQLTADACGITVHAGADQGTAMGNALGQALALGILKSPQEIRDVVAASVTNVTYRPQDQEAWAGKRRQYAKITG
jgi:rhamnulokinase